MLELLGNSSMTLWQLFWSLLVSLPNSPLRLRMRIDVHLLRTLRCALDIFSSLINTREARRHNNTFKHESLLITECVSRGSDSRTSVLRLTMELSSISLCDELSSRSAIADRIVFLLWIKKDLMNDVDIDGFTCK